MIEKRRSSGVARHLLTQAGRQPQDKRSGPYRHRLWVVNDGKDPVVKWQMHRLRERKGDRPGREEQPGDPQTTVYPGSHQQRETDNKQELNDER